ncbi:hypothetical protein Drose_06020 [Dactylosporangium roseum]|uniref:Uncharacterized protein n=1 Tax=Dactylosporangium roseum TaxID=47989 RepID=A0ABY5ZA10_9ACTN|nr:hypothetical protein [Dactylosporangium roseum]UWZ37828.1 hypothetical protein Drose_06020 [Dactylosporangium roseum]
MSAYKVNSDGSVTLPGDKSVDDWHIRPEQGRVRGGGAGVSASVFRNADGSARVVNGAGNWRVWRSHRGWIAVNDGPGDRTITDDNGSTRVFASAGRAIDYLVAE